jgi:hypothetical protein
LFYSSFFASLLSVSSLCSSLFPPQAPSLPPQTRTTTISIAGLPLPLPPLPSFSQSSPPPLHPPFLTPPQTRTTATSLAVPTPTAPMEEWTPESALVRLASLPKVLRSLPPPSPGPTPLA